MTRRGRGRCRGFRVLAATHLRTWVGPAPRFQSGPPNPGFVFGDLTAARKPATRASRISGGAGRGSPGLRQPWRSLHPGTECFRPPSYVSTQVGRVQPWLAAARSECNDAAHARLGRASLLAVTFARSPGGWPNHLARRLLRLRGEDMPTSGACVIRYVGKRASSGGSSTPTPGDARSWRRSAPNERAGRGAKQRLSSASG
jgi:hypothetical protein